MPYSDEGATGKPKVKPFRTIRPILSVALAAPVVYACADDTMEPPPNRAPLVVTAIPQQTVAVGEVATINASTYFTDPDGDHLSYAAESLTRQVALASLSDDTVRVRGVGQGTASVTVSARDSGGLVAAQAFIVTVPNRPPILTDSIPGLELFTGHSATIGLLTHFTDPDGDELVFDVETSNQAVAAASVSGDSLTVTVVAPGSSAVTVTARDPGGLTTSQAVEVTVPSRPPVLTDSIPDVTVFTGESTTIDLAAYFADPDGDTLVYVVESSDRAVVTADVSGSTTTVAALARGRVRITVIARDPSGLVASQVFSVEIPNRQPLVTKPIAHQALHKDRRVTIDLLDHFHDPDGDTLVFTAQTSDASVARIAASGSQATVEPVATGKASIGVVAEDRFGLSVSISFDVTLPENADRAALVALYEATGGPNWRTRTNWLTDAPLGRWFGVRTDARGRVVWLRLPRNNLSGRIPPELGWLTNLRQLSLQQNSIRGTIPKELANLANLQLLSLYYNEVSGPIPLAIGNLTSLQHLDLGWNKLTGPLPKELGNLDSLSSLLLGVNGLTGPIPPQLGRLSRLTRLHLYNNNLTGSIPPEVGRMEGLEELWLHANELTGPVPRELGSLTSLRELMLERNALNGSIPRELGNLTGLEWLSISSNDLTGGIPTELFSLKSLKILNLSDNSFQTGPIPPQIGGLVSLEGLGLGSLGLTGHIPPELGNLVNLHTLILWFNELTGTLPPELGNLSRMDWFRLHGNKLTGVVPRSFLQMDTLRLFEISANEDLCIPGLDDFADWLADIRIVDGTLCNADDRNGLVDLYHATAGGDWTDSDGWLSPAGIDRWHGVVTDSLGRVIELDLANNGLTGSLPAGLGDQMGHITVLRISGNSLSGPLPRSFLSLPLDEFHYEDTDLCMPPDNAFRQWISSIATDRGTEAECPALSEREILASLYNATDGPNWLNRNNWLSDAPLSTWWGVRVDSAGRVARLYLPSNRLAGSIPPELGDLVSLTELQLHRNALRGHIPSEIGRLVNLTVLRLDNTGLTGPIPPQIGNLHRLTTLGLRRTNLTGPIPLELGKLSGLPTLDLEGLGLTGPIPRQLGNLANLKTLNLARTNLSGPIPPELGDLGSLKVLNLRGTNLSGPIPAELGNLGSLETLDLLLADVSGPIPPELRTIS